MKTQTQAERFDALILEATFALKAAGLPHDANTVTRVLDHVAAAFVDEWDDLSTNGRRADAAIAVVNLCAHYRSGHELSPVLAEALGR